MFPKSSAAANAPSAADQSAWNQDISQAPLDPNSAGYIAYINAHGGDSLHPDFGSPREYGFPYAVVGKKQKRTKVNFTAYGDESDHGAYRVPLKALVEGGQASDGDRHVLAVDRKRCKLFELYRAFSQKRPEAPLERRRGRDLEPALGGAAHRRLHLGRRRRTADLPGPGPLRRGRLGPHRPRAARHRQLDPGRLDPPRLPLRRSTNATRAPRRWGCGCGSSAGYDISGFTGPARAIAVALKRYGLIVADNGSNWFISGTSDRRWPDENLDQLKSIPGAAFEVVQSAAAVHPC